MKWRIPQLLPLSRLVNNRQSRSTRSLSAMVAAFLVVFSSSSFAALCEYEVTNQWNTGFQAQVTITNNETSAIAAWSLSWLWSGDNRFDSGWNANFSCAEQNCQVSSTLNGQPIEVGDSYSFGFIGAKSTADAAELVTLAGAMCQTDLPEPSVVWQLDGTQSTLHYVSTKKDHVAENNTFSGATPAISGTIDSAGNAIVSINLADVQTGVDIRNTRLQASLFETEFLPVAYITGSIDIAQVSALNVGESVVVPFIASLNLHAVKQAVTTQVLIVKHSAQHVTVTAVEPILIDSKLFDMGAGIEALRLVASLTSIGESVPVYFRLRFNANTDSAVQPLAMPTAPAAANTLSAAFDIVQNLANLQWLHNSPDETGFIVRRKLADGVWATTSNLAANSLSFSEGLPTQGEFDYKVIAHNDGVASDASNIVRVVVTEGDPVARGQEMFSQQCSSCHGVNGEGIGSFPALNTQRDVTQMINTIVTTMPANNASSCDADCAADIAEYLQTLWPITLTCDRTIAPVSYGARQLKILTRSEYQRSVEDLVGVDFDVSSGLSVDEQIGFFRNNTHASVVPTSYSNLLNVAEEIATWSESKQYAPALSCTQFDQTCVDSLVSDFAPKVFRRPLTSTEITTYTALADGTETAGNIQEGIKLALMGLLSSPQFIYRHELGELNPNNPSIDTDAYELTSYEMATFLAYTFTGTTPDALLLQAANDDLLRDDAGILAQAQRLTGSELSKQVMGDFVGSWLGTEDLALSAKDATSFAGFEALVPDLQNEMRATFANIMLDGNESFASLFTANYTYLNEALASHYGIAGVTGTELRKVSTIDRGGILANGAFMARWGEAVETAPVIRSVRVRRRMLCQDQPAPPAGTFAAREQKLAELASLLQDPTTTNRTKYHRLTEDAACATCHIQYINPLGFGMEDFDTVGRVRAFDQKGNAIDSTGTLFAPNSYENVMESIAFTGTQGLGQTLAALPSAQSCLPKQMFRSVMGVGHDTIDSTNPSRGTLSETEQVGYLCEIDELNTAMMTDSPKAMLEKFSLLDSVRYRKAWPRQ